MSARSSIIHYYKAICKKNLDQGLSFLVPDLMPTYRGVKQVIRKLSHRNHLFLSLQYGWRPNLIELFLFLLIGNCCISMFSHCFVLVK